VPTATTERSRSSRPAEGPVLVRVATGAADWVTGLPPVPEGHRIGVTVGEAGLAGQAERLALRGYDLIDVVPGRRPGPHADLLVTYSLRAEDPRWFAALLLVAERVFDLRFGPVHVALRDELAAHLPPRDDT